MLLINSVVWKQLTFVLFNLLCLFKEYILLTVQTIEHILKRRLWQNIIVLVSSSAAGDNQSVFLLLIKTN